MLLSDVVNSLMGLDSSPGNMARRDFGQSRMNPDTLHGLFDIRGILVFLGIIFVLAPCIQLAAVQALHLGNHSICWRCSSSHLLSLILDAASVDQRLITRDTIAQCHSSPTNIGPGPFLVAPVDEQVSLRHKGLNVNDIKEHIKRETGGKDADKEATGFGYWLSYQGSTQSYYIVTIS